MLNLVYDKSYLRLFPVFIAAGIVWFVVCIASGHRSWGLLIMPAFLVGVLSLELRSGVALDAMWRASFRKGTRQHTATIAWQFLCLLAFIGVSYVSIVTRHQFGE